MAHSRAGQGLLPISFSFRAARIVVANRIAYFRRLSIESSSGNGENNHHIARHIARLVLKYAHLEADMEAKTDCWGLSDHTVKYTMLPDGDRNWSCSCGEGGHAADYREHLVQIIIAGVKETRRETGDPGKLSDDQLHELILAGFEQCQSEERDRKER